MTLPTLATAFLTPGNRFAILGQLLADPSKGLINCGKDVAEGVLGGLVMETPLKALLGIGDTDVSYSYIFLLSYFS